MLRIQFVVVHNHFVGSVEIHGEYRLKEVRIPHFLILFVSDNTVKQYVNFIFRECKTHFLACVSELFFGHLAIELLIKLLVGLIYHEL